MTIIIYTVAIFETRDGVFKMFDSHSRDRTGVNDPCGTCVLIEDNCLEELVEYFENLCLRRKCPNFQLKGVKILSDNVP